MEIVVDLEKREDSILLPNPRYLVINTYEELDKIFAIFNNIQILTALDISSDESQRIRDSLRRLHSEEACREYQSRIVKQFRPYEI